MKEEDFNSNKDSTSKENDEIENLIEKVENAYKIYKVSEVYLNNVFDDYGKLKIARLRLEFARHELFILLDEAKDSGVDWKNNEMIRNFLHPGFSERR